MASDLHVAVLAAGKGTRMKSDLPKVLHPVGGAAMIDHVLRAASVLEPASIVIVVGHMAEKVREALRGRPGLSFVVQEPQLGTAHALLQTEPALRGRTGTLVLLSGDAPLLRPETLQRLVRTHRERRADATLLTAELANPSGYGRIVRTQGNLTAVVEERDATPAEREIREINSGIYAFELEPLFPALRRVVAANAQGEYYLPDLVKIFHQDGRTLAAVVLQDADEIRGINSRSEMADVSTVMRQQRNAALMDAGVTLEDPGTAYIGPDVRIGPDTTVHAGVTLEGHTAIGSGCRIRSGVRIVDSVIGDGVIIHDHCLIVQSRIEAGASVGPFAHVRPDSVVGAGAHVGNFVELKKTTLGAGAKANHLAYLGDATIGAKANIGAGTITCNYDGTHKHATVVGDGAFIGSDSQLIAPVRVGQNAYVAAGSTITDDVPDGALGIARVRQVNKEGWTERKRNKP